MMGLPSGQVSIEDYTRQWLEAFEEECDRLVAAVGPLALAIEHVGSTSVPGLCAKPVIDIAIGVTDLLTGKECVGPLSDIAYEYKGDAGIPGRTSLQKVTRKIGHTTSMSSHSMACSGATIFSSGTTCGAIPTKRQSTAN